MSTDMRFDIVIIGSGAGGGTLAAKIAPSGKRILILERGQFLPREKENWDSRAVFGEKRYLARETWFDHNNQPFEPYTHYWVGGNTKVYGAALLRLREFDFGEIRHFGGISPAWPITYDILEPYYSRAECLYSVHGQRGLDPFDPPASGQYPYPPLTPEPRIGELYRDLHAFGARPFPVPLGVRLPAGSRSTPPYRLGNFDGYPDLTEVKADAHVVGVRAALEHANVQILTGAFVERLETDGTGREVTQIIARVGGKRLTVGADIVVLAAGAVNSAAILLRSVSPRHPRGLANSSDQVGRNYMSHHNGCFVMVSSEANDSQFQKHFAITDFYRGAPDSPFPLGTIQLMGKPDPGTLAWLRGDKLPGVSAEDLASRTIDFFLTSEDLPHPNNRVTIRDDGAIRISYTPNNLEAYTRLEQQIAKLLIAAERGRGRSQPTFLSSRLGISGVSHQSGTLRFGSDPATSVLNENCRAHDIENLYVADSSFFASSGAVNPSLTIMANSLRVGDRILEHLGASLPTSSAFAEAMP